MPPPVTDTDYPIWHPYAKQGAQETPTLIRSASGAYLTDEHGRQILDAISSWWVTLHGHAHPQIARAIYEQALKLEQVIFSDFLHQPALALSRALQEVLPVTMDKFFFSDNGSCAVEVALKIAVQYHRNRQQTQRKRILALQHGYHGDTLGAMSSSARSIFTQAFSPYLFEVTFIPLPAPGASVTLPHPEEEYACFIYEPLLQAAGGMHIHSPAALDTLLQHLKKHHILLIADEVLTGFGRTGTLFAGEKIKTAPDIMCLSKGLSGGFMPLGITACTYDIYRHFIENNAEDTHKRLFHGHSFTANPLACAAALCSLELLCAPSTQQQIAMIARNQQDFVQSLREEPLAQNPRSIGTVLAFEYAQPQSNYLSDIKSEIMRYFWEHNIYLRPLGNTIYFMPPYCTSPQALYQLYDITKKLLKERSFCS